MPDREAALHRRVQVWWRVVTVPSLATTTFSGDIYPTSKYFSTDGTALSPANYDVTIAGKPVTLTVVGPGGP